jgi:aquaporin Z
MIAYIAEFLGTFLLVFVVLATGNYLAVGAALALGVLLTAPISGGALNPAVAIAMLAAGKLTTADIVPYIVAEIAGALLAYEIYKILYKK